MLIDHAMLHLSLLRNNCVWEACAFEAYQSTISQNEVNFIDIQIPFRI